MRKSGRIFVDSGIAGAAQIFQNIQVREFLAHLSWSFLGGVFAFGLLLLSNILAGRWLGPEEYGKFSAVFTAAQALLVFMLLGMDISVARKLAREVQDDENRKKTVTNSLYLVFLGIVFFAGVSLILIFIFQSKFTSVEKGIALWSIFLAAMLAFRQVLESIARGKKRFKQQAILRLVEGGIIVSSFVFLFWVLDWRIYQSYVWALAFGAGMLVIGYRLFLVKKLGRPEKKEMLDLLQFGKIAFVANLLGTVFGTLDKFAIAHYLSFEQLGIYTAYFTVSILLVSQVGGLFDNVFFPTIAKMKNDLYKVTQIVDRLSLILFGPLVVGIFITVFFGMHFFGPSFEVVLSYVFGFSVIAALKFILIVNTSLITAHSEESLKLGVIYGNSINLLFIFIFLAFVSHYALTIQVMIYFLMVYMAGFIVLNKWILYRVGVYKKSIC